MDNIERTIRQYRDGIISRSEAYSILAAAGVSSERIESTLDNIDSSR